MKKYIPIILILLLTLPAARYLFGPGYFNMHDDLQVMRIFQMEKCFSDGQIPCRWSPDMAYGYGQAMFNFYSVFPYYLGVFIRIISPLSIMGTVMLLFYISLVVSAIGMYLLAREFWGKSGGILASVLYVYAPYHALDIFIRGALSESFALAVLPFIWLFIYKIIKKRNFYNVLGFGVSLAVLITSHNVSSLIYAPFTILWTLFWLIYTKKWKSIIDLAMGGIMGAFLASFFLIPNLVEQLLIQKEFLTMDYLDFRAHFVTIKQLFFDRSWGHGPSIYGPDDEISFQIGWPHWWLVFPLGALSILWFRKKKLKKYSFMIVGLLCVFFLSAFLTHSRSTPIWLSLPILSFVQFSWRFLGLVIFSISFVGGALAKPKIFGKLLSVILIFLAILLNFSYFKPWGRSYEVNDQEKLSGEAFELQQKSAILDYLPKTAPIAPKEQAFKEPRIISGEGNAYNFTKTSNSFFFDVEVYDYAQVQIPVMYFPGWKVVSRGKILESKITGDYGLITVFLPQGKHIVRGRFENTLARSFGNTITTFTVLFILVGVFLKENKKKFLWY